VHTPVRELPMERLPPELAWVAARGVPGVYLADEHPEIAARLSKLADVMRADLGDKGNPGPGIRPIGHVKNPLPVVLTKN